MLLIVVLPVSFACRANVQLSVARYKPLLVSHRVQWITQSVFFSEYSAQATFSRA